MTAVDAVTAIGGDEHAVTEIAVNETIDAELITPAPSLNEMMAAVSPAIDVCTADHSSTAEVLDCTVCRQHLESLVDNTLGERPA